MSGCSQWGFSHGEVATVPCSRSMISDSKDPLARWAGTMAVTAGDGVAVASVVGAESIAPSPGEPWPLGAHCDHEGTNFAVFSRHAMSMELWVFADAGASVPSMRIDLDRI